MASSRDFNRAIDQTFGGYVRNLLSERGQNQVWLAKALGASEGAVSKWTGEENKIPPAVVAEIARLLELPAIADFEQAKRVDPTLRSPRGHASHYHEGRSGLSDEIDAMQKQEFLAALEALRPDSVRAKNPERAKEVAEAKLAGLFHTMRLGHFVVVTTQTIPPAGFKPEEYKEVVAAIYKAMDEGALVAYIVPDAPAITRLKRYGFEGILSSAFFRAAFGRFAREYEARLRQGGHADPVGQTGKRTQLFEWSDFPMTPCGRTVSLVGESRGFGRVTSRILERNPITAGEVSLMAKNEADEERLRLFITRVIKTPAACIGFPRGKANKSSEKWFITELKGRMDGNLIGHPSPGDDAATGSPT